MNNILIPEDKANHCIYGAVAFLVMLFLFKYFGVVAPAISAALAVLVAAVGWELFRKYRYDYRIDPFDILASIAGPGLCLVARVL
jgi:hypothetical protein